MATIQNQHFKGQIPWRSEWDLFKKQFSQDIFGGKDWERYFGAIGNEPIIHDDSIDFLKQLLKTHLLLLIPQKVNGHPFTLNYLHNLIENKIAPTFYDKDIRSELGEQQTSHSYWVIMTKRPNWCSEAKEYQFYYKKLENIQKRKSRLFCTKSVRISNCFGICDSDFNKLLKNTGRRVLSKRAPIQRLYFLQRFIA